MKERKKEGNDSRMRVRNVSKTEEGKKEIKKERKRER